MKRGAKIQNKSRVQFDKAVKSMIKPSADVEDLDSSLNNALSRADSQNSNSNAVKGNDVGGKSGRRVSDPTKYCFESQKKIDKLQ